MIVTWESFQLAGTPITALVSSYSYFQQDCLIFMIEIHTPGTTMKAGADMGWCKNMECPTRTCKRRGKYCDMQIND